MAGESPKQATEDQVETLIDDLIGKIFGESGLPAGSSMHDMAATAAMFEATFGSGRAGSRISMLERLLVAQTFATELADALAPALAEQLAPRLLMALDELMANGSAAKQQPQQPQQPKSNGRAGGQGRNPADTK